MMIKIRITCIDNLKKKKKKKKTSGIRSIWVTYREVTKGPNWP